MNITAATQSSDTDLIKKLINKSVHCISIAAHINFFY